MSELGHTVDIVTRQIKDPVMQGFESVIDHYDGYINARIIRIPAGPESFLEKEKLWPILYEWVKNVLDFYKQENQSVDFITTHYADGGKAGVLLAKAMGIPYSFTGHSLGAQKMDKLSFDEANRSDLNARFKFDFRLASERTAIRNASIIFTSTPQEKDEQYMHKAYQDITSQKKEVFVVAPPGVNEKVFGHDAPNPTEYDTHAHIEKTLKRDIDPHRLDLPSVILASRLDQKKNHMAVLRAYAKSKSLQSMMNIVISVRGIEDAYTDYSSLKEEEHALMSSFMDHIQTHHLKGKVAFVNITSQNALASTYRYFALHQGAFSLTSTYEPFGLAPIEAMCAGLPVAVTKYGGPADVLEDESGSYGVLLDVLDDEQMIRGFQQLFKHYEFYKSQGISRVKQAYTWKSTAKTYIDAIQKVLNQKASFNTEHYVIEERDLVLDQYYL